MMNAEKVKAIKRINERLAEYERNNLQGAIGYINMKNAIQSFEVDTKGKNGNIRVSRSKEKLEKIPDFVLKRLLQEETFGQAKKEAKKRIKKRKGNLSESDIVKEIEDYGMVKEFLDNELNNVYEQAKMGNEYALQLNDMLDLGLRNYDYSEIIPIINSYKKRAMELQQIYMNEGIF